MELLAIQSTAEHPDELIRALDLVIDYVRAPGGVDYTVERFESGGKPSALLYIGPVRPRFRVLFNAHLDVVPGEPAQFRPRIEEGRLWGRGAQDMKLSALTQALVFREMAGELPYPLGLQLVTDEELGGRDGTERQLSQGVTTDFAIVGEHSALDIVADSKGFAQVRLSAVGLATHGAYPWLGRNAVLSVIEAVGRVLARYPVPTQEEWRTTVNVSWISTPNRAVNQVPGIAEGWLDIRFPPGDTDFDGRTSAEIGAHLADLCGPDVTVEVAQYEPPHHADHASADVAALRLAAQAQGYPARFLRKHGSADGRFFSRRGIDAVMFGVGGGGQHGPDEYADLSTLVPYHSALTAFLANIP